MPVLDYILKNSKSYRECLIVDVVPHFNKIKQWIPEEEAEAFQNRMRDCVEEENAWALNDSFLYYTKVDRRMAHGVALFGGGEPMDILALFIGVFSLEDTDTFMLRFKLHPGKLMDEYKSLLTAVSMKRAHQNQNHPLMVRIDGLRKKIWAI
jgi:hypothetical protein